MKKLILDDIKLKEFKILQNDFIEKRKISRLAKQRLENFIKDNTINELKTTNEFLIRDLSLVEDFLKKNKLASTKQLCDFLNDILKNDYVRWHESAKYYNNKLTSAIFHSYIGNQMLNDNHNRFTYDKIEGNKNIWKLK